MYLCVFVGYVCCTYGAGMICAVCVVYVWWFVVYKQGVRLVYFWCVSYEGRLCGMCVVCPWCKGSPVVCVCVCGMFMREMWVWYICDVCGVYRYKYDMCGKVFGYDVCAE